VTINDPGYEVPATQSHDPGGAADLRLVADHLVAPSGRPAEHVDAALACRHQAKDGAHECRLAGAVRPKHAHQLAWRDLQTDAGQHGAAA
jgi:hypothetical protein